MSIMETNEKFTRIAASLLGDVKDLIDWGVVGGHTTADQMKLTVTARKAAVLHLRDQGLSQRQIAKAVGCDQKTISNDLLGKPGKEEENYSDGEENSSDGEENSSKVAGTKPARKQPSLLNKAMAIVKQMPEQDREELIRLIQEL